MTTTARPTDASVVTTPGSSWTERLQTTTALCATCGAAIYLGGPSPSDPRQYLWRHEVNDRTTCPTDGLTSAQRDENRLTDADRATMRRAIAEAVARWEGPRELGADVEALVRIGAHAIGCGLVDLRTSEVAELRMVADHTARTGA